MERLPHGTRRLAAQLSTQTHSDFIWSALTDYDHLSDFIPNLSTSILISKVDNCVHLKQVGCQQLMGLKFSAKVQIELIEYYQERTLNFRLLKGDFRRFEGAWRIKETNEGKGSRLFYELTVQGCIGMPVTLIEQRLREDLKTNLLAVEAEAARRSLIKP
ncbi:SRPBCC family protein [Prochlorococcus sp. MIT 1300]|uniref:SRPBCC family protein n=1 Tax=Prochlorococcus sp. MIT 1300 TaxID=3096218 RepID=UPI002A75E219|nr:SRPBCC family protein [Prochlorococcus sp. MIT 1300]